MEFGLITRVAGLAALAVVAVEQLLKLKFIPVAFANRYPVVTNLVLSLGASLLAVWQDFVQPVVWTDWVLLVATVAVVAAVVYNQLLANWSQLRAMEGEK